MAHITDQVEIVDDEGAVEGVVRHPRQEVLPEVQLVHPAAVARQARRSGRAAAAAAAAAASVVGAGVDGAGAGQRRPRDRLDVVPPEGEPDERRQLVQGGQRELADQVVRQAQGAQGPVQGRQIYTRCGIRGQMG